MYFSPQGEKIPKELLRLPPQTPMLLLGSSYPRLEGVAVLARLAQATTRRAGSNVRLGSSRPRAQGARRVSAFRYDIDEHGGD